MKILALLCLVGLSLTYGYYEEDEDYDTYYAVEGDQVKLTSFSSSGTFFWAKGRSWQEHFDQITAPNNCTFRKQYGDRIHTCGQTLTLTNLSWSDSAIYRVRARFPKRVSNYQYFRLWVFGSLPILSLVTDEPNRVVVRCDDLKNPYSQLSIEHQSQGSFTELTSNIAQIGPQVFDLRCCSTFKNVKTCGPWRKVAYGPPLITNSTLPACSDRNTDNVKTLSRVGTPIFTGNLTKSQCKRETVSRPFELCEGRNHTLISPKYASWFKLREFGGRRRVFKGEEWFFLAQRNYTGDYEVAGKNFSLLVLPILRVSVEIVEIEYGRWVLRCAHNGRPEAAVTWTVGGQYGEYQLMANNTIIVYPDCRESENLLVSQMGLKCSVRDGPWIGRSLWVHSTHKKSQ